MLGKEENWFQKNRGFILGFAVVVLVRIKNDYQRMKALRIRQEEKVRWYTLRSRK